MVLLFPAYKPKFVNLAYGPPGGPVQAITRVHLPAGKIPIELLGPLSMGYVLLGVAAGGKRIATLPEAQRALQKGPFASTKIAPLRTELERLKWILIPDGKLLMEEEVSDYLFNLVMRETTIKNETPGRFGKTGKAMTGVSLINAKAFCSQLSWLTKIKVAIPTHADWLLTRAVLSGNNWVWTDSLSGDGRSFVASHLSSDGTRLYSPLEEADDLAFRIVIKPRWTPVNY